MDSIWPIYLGAFLVAFMLCCILTPIAKALAWKLNFLDKPHNEGHKQHSDATPVLGGAAITLSWMVTLAIGYITITENILNLNSLEAISPGVFKRTLPLWVLMGGAGAFCLLGMVDDRNPMSAKVKLFLQIFICAIVSKWGFQITFFTANPLITWLLTFCWMMFILNAINFYDNMDGLCTGVTAIAATMFFLVASLQGHYLVALLAIVTAASCFGFYVFNSNPASIFMGDSGSHFCGYMLAVLGGLVTYYDPETSVGTFSFLVPFAILALPIFDTFAVILIRLHLKEPIYIGDNNHISHRFVKMGFSRRCSVGMIHLLCITAGLSGVALMYSALKIALIIIVQLIAIFIFLTLLHSRQNREKS